MGFSTASLYLIHGAVQVVIPESPGACEVMATQVLGLCPKAGDPLLKMLPGLPFKSSSQLFQGPA
jgi:hypothetical protein